MSYLALSDLFKYPWYGSTAIINYVYSYSARIDFSRQNLHDVYRRQILTTKVDPRAVRVKDITSKALQMCKCFVKY